jgi:hypothetical protein
MDDSFNGLRQKVLQAVSEQRSRPDQTPVNRQQAVLAQYVQVSLTRLGITEERFVQLMNLHTDQTRLLLQAKLPEQYLSDAVIQRLAQILQCEPNLLRIMLNRPVVAQADSQSDSLDLDSDDAVESV